MKRRPGAGAMLQIINETLPALQALKAQGLVRFVGITCLPLNSFRYVLDRAPPGRVDAGAAAAAIAVVVGHKYVLVAQPFLLTLSRSSAGQADRAMHLAARHATVAQLQSLRNLPMA
jgi:hypothetical protein